MAYRKGDYVLATKWGDGDPKDPWCIGRYSEAIETPKGTRHIVTDNDGVPFRSEGFRRVRRISQHVGLYILYHATEIEESGRNLYGLVRELSKKLTKEVEQ